MAPASKKPAISQLFTSATRFRQAEQADANHQQCTDHIQPEERNYFQVVDDDNGCFSYQCGDEDDVAAGPFYIECHKEDAEYSTVKKRAENVDRFDKRAHTRSEHCYSDTEYPPAKCVQASQHQLFFFRWLAAMQELDIHH